MSMFKYLDKEYERGLKNGKKTLKKKVLQILRFYESEDNYTEISRAREEIEKL